MADRVIHHALVLNLHQPAGNLAAMLETDPWEVRQILCAYDRIPRSLWRYEDVGRVHLAMSGTLLETLSDPAFQSAAYGMVRLGDLLWYLQNERIIEILGTGYYHPVLPLIPSDDRIEQVRRWLGLGRHLFWREFFAGFWPPELGFSMELIPLLADAGYRYVIVDSAHVVGRTPLRWHELRYRPHMARHGGREIVVVVRDRELSIAQESGMEPEWFLREVRARTRHCDFDPLVVTATDGENGGWFRNLTPGETFWDRCHAPLMKGIQSGEIPDLRPTFIDEYIAKYGVHGEVIVRAGAWNTGEHDGTGFVQWTGSDAQKAAWRRVREISRRARLARDRAQAEAPGDDERRRRIEDAYWRLLRAQTSCHFFWGDAWLARCHADLDAAETRLAELV